MYRAKCQVIPVAGIAEIKRHGVLEEWNVGVLGLKD